VELDLRLIVPTASGHGILLDAAGRLPRLAVDGDQDEAVVIAVDQILREEWRFPAPILETHPQWDGVAEGDPIPVLVTTEPAPAAWEPPGSLVFGIEGTADLDGLPEPLVPRARELLAELRTRSEPPPLRPRWARSGWHARASAWMQSAAAARGCPLTGEPRPFFLRGISALLRAPTDDRDLFLKAVFPPFHAEPVITRLLAERFPDDVPRVVDVEADEGWLLVEDVDAGFVQSIAAADRPAAVALGVRTLVAIQRALAAEPEEIADLERAGAPRRPLAAIPDELGRSLALDGLGYGDEVVTPERRAAAVGRAREAVRRLDEIGVPETLVHGDFHNGNVALARGRTVILDWSDAAIGSPFVDLVTWTSWTATDSELHAATEGWLGAWSQVVDVDALRDRLDDVLVVGSAYQVISYDGICRALEPATRYTMAGGGDNFLKRIEARLRAGSTAT